MFRKLRDVPECLGDIDGVDYDADITVKFTDDQDVRNYFVECVAEEYITVTLNKLYHAHKITAYGDVFDVCIINDKGEEEAFGSWFFEDVD